MTTIEPRRLTRNLLGRYLEFEKFCEMDGRYEVKRADITINFSDLKGCLADLSPRKKQALYLNVICDLSQQEVAKLMGIAPGSVGQYVDQATREVALVLFPELEHS